MIDFIKQIRELATENNSSLGILVTKEKDGYELFVSNKYFSAEELRKIAKHAEQIKLTKAQVEYGLLSQWKIPAPEKEAEKLILESNLFLLCLKVLGKTQNKV